MNTVHRANGNYLVILILLIALCTGLSCKNKSQVKENPRQEFLASGFSDKYNPLDKKNASKFKLAYYLDNNSVFKGYYGVSNSFKKKNSYRIIALLNYKQVPIALDGNEKISHAVTLDKWKQKIYRFSTNPIPEGSNDFIMVLLKNINKHDTSPRFRMEEVFSQPIRTNLISKNEKKRIYPQTKISSIVYRTNTTDALIINQNKAELEFMFKSRFKEKTELFVHLSNTTNYSKQFALVGFINDSQVDLQGHKVIFTNVEPKTRLVIPISIAPQKALRKQTSELSVFAIASPGLKMDDMKIKKQPEYDESILASNRVALVVE